MNKRVIKNTINAILVVILIYSSYNILKKLSNYKKADEIYTNLQKIKIESQINNTNINNNTDEEIKNESDKLLLNNNTNSNINNKKPINNNKSNTGVDFSNINPDYRFWINIENTNIDYPVLQAKNNSYYLSKDIYKNNLESGSIFLDYTNNNLYDKNTIIYGHNMKNKTMFSELENFKDPNFFNQNNKIIITTPEKSYTYEVFSAYYINADYNYMIISFNNENDYKKYLTDVKNKSLNKSNINVSTDDKILTLSTCSYESDNTRTVIHAKLIK